MMPSVFCCEFIHHWLKKAVLASDLSLFLNASDEIMLMRTNHEVDKKIDL